MPCIFDGYELRTRDQIGDLATDPAPSMFAERLLVRDAIDLVAGSSAERTIVAQPEAAIRYLDTIPDAAAGDESRW